MNTGSRPLLAAKISPGTVICLGLAAVLLTSCDRPTGSNATITSSSPAPGVESALTGVILRANPNPVPNGSPDGNTTITWDTGSNDVGDVYVRLRQIVNRRDGVSPGARSFSQAAQRGRRTLHGSSRAPPNFDFISNPTTNYSRSSPLRCHQALLQRAIPRRRRFHLHHPPRSAAAS